MDKWNWTAIGIVSGILLTVGGWLGTMINNIKKDVANQTTALREHIVEDKAVADDVKDLKSEMRDLSRVLNTMAVDVARTATVVQQMGVQHGILPTLPPTMP